MLVRMQDEDKRQEFVKKKDIRRDGILSEGESKFLRCRLMVLRLKQDADSAQERSVFFFIPERSLKTSVPSTRLNLRHSCRSHSPFLSRSKYLNTPSRASCTAFPTQILPSLPCYVTVPLTLPRAILIFHVYHSQQICLGSPLPSPHNVPRMPPPLD